MFSVNWSMIDPILASVCNVYHPELIFTSHILITVVDVKASGPPHICVMWLVVSKGHAAKVVLSLQQLFLLSQSIFIGAVIMLR